MSKRSAEVSVPIWLQQELAEIIAAADWRLADAAETGSNVADACILALDGTDSGLEEVRAHMLRSAAPTLATLVLVVGDAAIAQACASSWPATWAWLPWPQSPQWLALSLKLAMDQTRAVAAAAVLAGAPITNASEDARRDLLAEALSASGLFDFEYDLATGVRTPRYRDLQSLGYSPKDIDEVIDLIHPEDRQTVAEAFAHSRDSGESYHVEVRITRQNGEYRWIRSKASVLGRSATHPGRLLGVSWDIHEERQAIESARLAKLRLDQALATAGMLSWEWNAAEVGRRIVGNGLILAAATDAKIYLDDLICAEDRVADSARFAYAIAHGSAYRSDVRIELPDSGLHWLRLTGHPKSAGANETITMSGLALDITRQRAMDEELADARALLINSLEAGRMYCWEWNLSDGSRRTVGPSREILGLSPTSLQGAVALTHPDDEQKNQQLLDETIYSGAPYQNECRIIRGDGQIRWLFSRGSAIRDEQGQITRVSGVSIDVTDRRLAQEAWSKANDRLEIALDAARLNAWSVDLVTGVHDIGPRDIELFGEVIQSPEQFLSLVVPEDRPQVAKLNDQSFLASGASTRIEYRIQRRDGSMRWLACHARALLNHHHEPIQLVGVSYDITEARQAQLKLAQSLTQLERVQTATHVVLWEWNRIDGPRCLLSGGQEFSGGSLPTIHPDDVRRVIRRLLRCTANNEVFNEEFRVQNGDAYFSWVTVHGARSSFDAEHGATLSGVMIDISAPRRAAEQLAIAQERLRRALDAAKMVCWDWTIDDSGSAAGYTPQVTSATGAAVGSVIDPRDRELHQTAIRDALSGASPDYRCEFRVRRADDSVVWLLSIGNRLCDASGRVTGLTGVAIDITAQREVESELEESRQWQRMAVEAGELNLWRIDVITGERFGGALDERLFGFVPTTVAEVERLIHPDDRAQVESTLRQSFEKGLPYRLEYRIIVGASTRWLRARGKPLIDRVSGHPQMVGATLEITEQKSAEVELRGALRLARKASEAKSAFLASISHELRTPLNAVIGFSHLLEATELDATQQAHLQALRSGANQLYALINNVLDFSRIEAGEMALERTPFSLHDCLEPALDMVTGVADAKELCLLMTSRGCCHRQVIGDPMRLRQVAVNLLANAAKFTEQGSVEFEVEASERDDRMALVMRIRDTGIGMEAAVLDGLYQPFRQGDVSTTRRFGGTGLGLSICKHLVELMNGKIHATSTPGVGSCFEVNIELPFADSREDEESQYALIDRRIGIATRSAVLQHGLRRQIEAFGAQAVVIDPAQLTATLLDDRGDIFDALIVAKPLLDELSGVRSWPMQRNGTPVPTIVLVGINHHLQAWRGACDQRLIPLVRAIKPMQLLKALNASLDFETRVIEVAASTSSDDATAEARPGEFDGLRLLVAEDIDVNRLLLTYQLESLGVTAVMVSDGQEVLDRMLEQPFDAILMDVEMPGMDGMEAASRLRTDPAFAHRSPYIIAVTAHVLGDSRTRFLTSGMDDFVSKPVMLDNLREALKRALATKALR